MPELIEVEAYRRAAEVVVGRRVRAVDVLDRSFVRGALSAAALADAVVGRTVVGTGRLGKLMWLDLEDGHRLGIRFGMTGRIVVDGNAPIGALEYGPTRDDPAWERFALVLTGPGRLVVSDPRRLGGVELDPDLRRLGPEASTVRAAALAAALEGTTTAVKAALLDQSRLAGVGNLIADETLWRAGLDPHRPAAEVADAGGVPPLAAHLRRTVRLLTRRGGSHTGDLQSQRHRDGACPRCATPLRRSTIAGRTTYWCPDEQR